MGYILLEGGAEFGGGMEAPDRRALELAGGLHVRTSIIPTAAVPADDHQNAGNNGVQWFRSLGASTVSALPLIDRQSANDQTLVAILLQSRLIYMLGGSPHYLGQAMTGSGCWQAALAAHESGAVIGGSSAGAMVLCEHYYDPFKREVYEGLRLIPGACVIPHHDTIGQSWISHVQGLLPSIVLIGIDEQTGMLNDGPQGQWLVYGKGRVTLYQGQNKSIFAPHCTKARINQFLLQASHSACQDDLPLVTMPVKLTNFLGALEHY
jgi:cyanophycinase